MKLTSNSTQYSTQLYPGGLVSSVNNLQIGSDQPLPYWFVTINGSFDNGNLSFSRNRINPALVPPCIGNNNDGFILVLPNNQSMPGLQLQSSCGTVQVSFYIGQTVFTAEYVTLQDDGYLHAYSYAGNSLVPLVHTEPGGVISFPFSPISNYDREALYPCACPMLAKRIVFALQDLNCLADALPLVMILRLPIYFSPSLLQEMPIVVVRLLSTSLNVILAVILTLS